MIARLTAVATKLLAILATPVWRNALLRHGVAAGAEHAAVLRSLSTICTVVDVGANRGQFALAALQCFPHARVFSFEPLPFPAGLFRKVFARNERVTLHEVAIGPMRGWGKIHVSARDDSSSLLPISNVQAGIFPGTGEVAVSEVRIAPLEEFASRDDIRPPALLKIDVQGYELDALRGCEPLLPYFSSVYTECSFLELYSGQALADEVIAWLRQRGFKLSGIYNVVYGQDGLAVQGDFLFESML